MKRYDFIVLGGTGLQGRICSRDLLDSGYSVLIVGRNPEGVRDLLLNKKAGFLKVDLNNFNDIVNSIKNSGASVVVNCAELKFNIDIMKACLKTGKSCTDLGGLQYVTEQQFKLDSEFRNKGIINITGCGSTPGILNVLTAKVVKDYDSVESIYLGFAWDSNIKKFVVPYSIESIFDEFTQDPVTFSNGEFVKDNRLECKGTFNFEEVGKQTVYCIVHSEVFTFAKYFKDKGIKNIYYMAGFPEHSLKVIKTLMDLGFDSKKPISVNGKEIIPLEFTSSLLKNLRQPEGYKEVENLWVKIDGVKNGQTKRTEINCIVKTLDGWENAGSNVDTGRTISIISQMLKQGKIKEKGVCGPELVVPSDLFLRELGKRNMYVYLDGRKIN